MPQTVNLSSLTKGREIAAGGEGKVYEHPSDKNKVIKVYHQARSSSFMLHLQQLAKLSLADGFVTPGEIYVDKSGQVLGFDNMLGVGTPSVFERSCREMKLDPTKCLVTVGNSASEIRKQMAVVSQSISSSNNTTVNF